MTHETPSIKTFLVTGFGWTAEVPIDTSDINADDVGIEVASRAVEAKLSRRADIEIHEHPPISLTPKQMASNPLHSTILQLLNDELIEGCGIGMLLCITMPESVDGKDEPERYISSKDIFQNIGYNPLISVFDQKYPQKTQTT